MSEHTPPTGFGPVADELLPHATRRAIHALWQAEGSRQYIDDIVTQTDAHLGDIESEIVAARTAYGEAIGTFTGEEACVLADRLDAEEQAIDFLPVISDDISQAADAIMTLFQKSLFIETESAGDEFHQRVHGAATVREEARSMVGGATIAVDALDQIADYHPNVDRDEINLPSRDAEW